MIRILMLCMTALTLNAAVMTDSWSADVRKHSAVDRVYKQGEAIDMRVTVQDGFSAYDLTGARAVFYWFTNSVGNVWWTNSVSIATPKPGVLSVRWTPAMDVGALAYPYWIGIWPSGSTSPVWRLTGTIKLLPSPGFVPNSLLPPVRMLDFAAVTVTNSPWLKLSDWQNGSNALAGAVQTLSTNVSAQIALATGGLARASSVTSISQAVVSVQASLGVMSSQTESNRLAIAAASTYSGPGWIDPTGGVWNVSYAPVLMDEAWMLTVTTPMWTAWDEDYGTNLIYGLGTYTYEAFEHAPPVPLYHNAVDYTFDGRDVRINFSTSGFSMYLSYAMSGQNFTAATTSTNLPVVLTASGAGVGQGTLWFRPAGWYPGSGPETVTSRVDAVALVSALEVTKELHRDSCTNLIWRTVWSNGWCWAIAYTNTP